MFAELNGLHPTVNADLTKMLITVERFAEEADRFEQWAESAMDNGQESACNALIRLTSLYWRGLELPSRGNGDPSGVDQFRVSDAHWKAVFERTGRLPFNYYGVVFDTTQVPPEASVIGSLSDDIADIFLDVVLGLRLYNAGRHDEALWNWVFSMWNDWGRHATSAISAIHNWFEMYDL